ncbi:MAG: hypothetical protein ACYC6Y_12030 [Thermoguttaceae bacterium]
MIVLSLVCFCVETLPNLGAGWQRALYLLFIGLGLIAVPSGLFASTLAKSNREKE